MVRSAYPPFHTQASPPSCTTPSTPFPLPTSPHPLANRPTTNAPPRTLQGTSPSQLDRQLPDPSPHLHPRRRPLGIQQRPHHQPDQHPPPAPSRPSYNPFTRLLPRLRRPFASTNALRHNWKQSETRLQPHLRHGNVPSPDQRTTRARHLTTTHRGRYLRPHEAELHPHINENQGQSTTVTFGTTETPTRPPRPDGTSPPRATPLATAQPSELLPPSADRPSDLLPPTVQATSCRRPPKRRPTPNDQTQSDDPNRRRRHNQAIPISDRPRSPATSSHPPTNPAAYRRRGSPATDPTPDRATPATDPHSDRTAPTTDLRPTAQPRPTHHRHPARRQTHPAPSRPPPRAPTPSRPPPRTRAPNHPRPRATPPHNPQAADHPP